MARFDYTRTPPLYAFLKARAGVKDGAYLPRGPRFARVLLPALKTGGLSHPTQLFDDQATLPVRQFLPDHVQNRYVHVALCHDPRVAYPDYLKALDPYHLGAAHAAILGLPVGFIPDPDRALLEFARWTCQIGVYVWMWDPLTRRPQKTPGDPEHLPGTPWDDLRYHNAHATTKTVQEGLRSIGVPEADVGNRDRWLDALEERVYTRHVPKFHGDYKLTSERDLPLKTPSFLAPSTRRAPKSRKHKRRHK